MFRGEWITEREIRMDKESARLHDDRKSWLDIENMRFCHLRDVYIEV